MYGSQPMPPSDSANFRFGCLWNTGENSKSAVQYIELHRINVIITVNGASGAVIGVTPDVPKCMHNGNSASCAVANTLSQWSVWNDGSASGTGFDPWALQVIELAPDGVAEITFFLSTATLFPLFGLPLHLDA